MKLLFKQRMFSWFDSYDIYDEYGEIKYIVKGQLSWGHLLKIYDRNNQEVGYIKERILTFLPKFEIYVKDNYQVVGIMNLLTNLATIIFAYFYGKKINEKDNYVRLSILFMSLVYFLKANSISYILLVIVSFLEGIASKMYELSISKSISTSLSRSSNGSLIFFINLS